MKKVLFAVVLMFAGNLVFAQNSDKFKLRKITVVYEYTAGSKTKVVQSGYKFGKAGPVDSTEIYKVIEKLAKGGIIDQDPAWMVHDSDGWHYPPQSDSLVVYVGVDRIRGIGKRN